MKSEDQWMIRAFDGGRFEFIIRNLQSGDIRRFDPLVSCHCSAKVAPKLVGKIIEIKNPRLYNGVILCNGMKVVG